MKSKFGAIVVDGRGKLGGHVASKNRAGSYFRTKVTPTNPGTTYQVNVRNRLAVISTSWRGLTAGQRLAWNMAVSDFKKTDIFGDIRNPTGFNLYQRLVNNLYNVGVAGLVLPPLPEAVFGFTTLSVAAANGAQTVTVTFTAAIPSGTKIKAFATHPISPGISYANGRFRQFDVLTVTDTSPLSAETEYIAKFGAIGAAGMKIFIRLVPVNTDTGQAGLPMEASCIIAA